MILSKEVELYVKQNSVNIENAFFLVVDYEGAIKSLENSGTIFIAKPTVGERIDNFLSALVGVFPIEKDVYFPNVQITHGSYFNIHLLKNNNEVLIILEDVSLRIDELNERIFLSKDLCQSQFELLKELGYMVLKKEKEEEFIPAFNCPDWVNTIIEDEHELLDGGVTEVFPFLEYFISQSDESKISSEVNKSYSGIWTQTAINNNEIHLNAWHFNMGDICYLIIHTVDSGFASEQNIIQLARENTLAYEELKKVKLELQDLLILKDKFVSIVSHDFRSPLSSIYDGISFLTEDLQNGNTIDDDHIEIIGQVQKEITRLLDYNNKLYEWTKMNLENLEISTTEVDMVLLLSELTQKFDARIKEKNLEFQIEIEREVVLITDYVLFNQAISNIIDNAIKFSPEQAVIRIILSESQLTISDAGVGIPQNKILEILKGYSLKSTRGTNGEVGTGLGLNIVTRILTSLNFDVKIDSEIDKGTTFIISIK